MDYLRDTVIKLLDQYQIDKINKSVNECLTENKEAKTYIFHTCPKCGKTQMILLKVVFPIQENN